MRLGQKMAQVLLLIATTSPSGIVDADTLTADGTFNRHRGNSINVLQCNLTYTFQFMPRKTRIILLQLTLGWWAFGTSIFANFDVNNGVLVLVGSGYNCKHYKCR
jgi:hypothetical protein